MNYWPLLGVAAVVAGFALRWNPILVVVISGLLTGLLAGISPWELLGMFGEAFAKNRFLLIIVLTLPCIGILERHGLRERAAQWIRQMRAFTVSRLLLAYLGLRQITGALGLTSLGGHALTVRPLLAPMVEAKAAQQQGELSAAQTERLRALSAATDNVGLFFGEDIFIAFGAVLLMQSFLAQNGIVVDPLAIALWGIPTAGAAFVIHGVRVLRLDAELARERAALALRAPDATDNAA